MHCTAYFLCTCFYVHVFMYMFFLKKGTFVHSKTIVSTAEYWVRDTACSSSATLLYFYRNSVPTSILARYQACQVTNQLEISSLNLQLESRLFDWLAIYKLLEDILRLIGHVTISVTCKPAYNEIQVWSPTQKREVPCWRRREKSRMLHYSS
jgi:hypothetical protein